MSRHRWSHGEAGDIGDERLSVAPDLPQDDLELRELTPVLRAVGKSRRRAGQCSAPPSVPLLHLCRTEPNRLLVALLLDVERSSADANISDFGDAIWWAVTTMTTVGYGDHYPVTGIGRAVGFGLMLPRSSKGPLKHTWPRRRCSP